jgi:hypothetical protein
MKITWIMGVVSIDRSIAEDVRFGLKHFPAAAVVGQRQPGKSTLKAA